MKGRKQMRITPLFTNQLLIKSQVPVSAEKNAKMENRIKLGLLINVEFLKKKEKKTLFFSKAYLSVTGRIL